MENNNYRVVFSSDAMSDTTPHISHYGKKGMKWGVVHEEIPNAPGQYRFNFRGAPPRSMTGDNRVKKAPTPLETPTSKQSWERSIEEHDAYVNSVTPRVSALNTKLQERGVWNGVVKQWMSDPDKYRDKIDELGQMINSYMADTYTNLNLQSKPPFDEFRRDFLNMMSSNGWTGLDRLVSSASGSNRGAVKNIMDRSEKFSSPHELAKSYFQTMPSVRNPKSYWGVAKKKQVGGR